MCLSLFARYTIAECASIVCAGGWNKDRIPEIKRSVQRTEIRFAYLVLPENACSIFFRKTLARTADPISRRISIDVYF